MHLKNVAFPKGSELFAGLGGMPGPLIVIYAGLGKLSFSWGCGAGTKYFKISLVCNASVFLNPLTVGSNISLYWINYLNVLSVHEQD